MQEGVFICQPFLGFIRSIRNGLMKLLFTLLLLFFTSQTYSQNLSSEIIVNEEDNYIYFNDIKEFSTNSILTFQNSAFLNNYSTISKFNNQGIRDTSFLEFNLLSTLM